MSGASEDGWELNLDVFFRETRKLRVICAPGVGEWSEGFFKQNPDRGRYGHWTRLQWSSYRGYNEWLRGVRGLQMGSKLSTLACGWSGEAMGE